MTFNFPRVLMTLVALGSIVLFGFWVGTVFFPL